MSHVHRITGERVTVTATINGITVFDTADTIGEELLTDVFTQQFRPHTCVGCFNPMVTGEPDEHSPGCPTGQNGPPRY